MVKFCDRIAYMFTVVKIRFERYELMPSGVIQKITFSSWSYFSYAFKGLSTCFYRSFTLEVASSTPALLFYTYAWPKIDSFAIHSFSGLEKHSRSNFKHWKSFFHGLLYFFIHTLGSKSIHLPFIHSQASKSSVEATSSTESRFFMACSTFWYIRLAQNRFICHSYILKAWKAQ